jgi:hypothetical protein
MMKYFRIVAMLVCAAALSVALLSAQEDASEVPAVEVIHVSGSPRVCKAGETEYTAIEEGMFLKAGDKIKTDKSESVELSFDEDNKNVVRVEDNTSISLTLKDEKIELSRGRVFSMIEELPAEAVFEIRTPTAVAGVRGTDWVTSIEDEETVVEAVDGTPYVKGIDESGKVIPTSVTVLPGYMTRVRRFQMPAVLKKIPVENRMSWKQVRSELKQRAIEAIQKRGPDYRPHPRPINLKALRMKGGHLQDNRIKGKDIKLPIGRRVAPRR